MLFQVTNYAYDIVFKTLYSLKDSSKFHWRLYKIKLCWIWILY